MRSEISKPNYLKSGQMVLIFFKPFKILTKRFRFSMVWFVNDWVQMVYYSDARYYGSEYWTNMVPDIWTTNHSTIEQIPMINMFSIMIPTVFNILSLTELTWDLTKFVFWRFFGDLQLDAEAIAPPGKKWIIDFQKVVQWGSKYGKDTELYVLTFISSFRYLSIFCKAFIAFYIICGGIFNRH